MLNRLTYKTKINLLLAGGAIALWMFFSMFVSDTFFLLSEQSRLTDSLSVLDNAPQELNLLNIKLKRLEKKAGVTTKKDSRSVQQYLMEIVTQYSNNNNCIVRSIPSISLYKEKDIVVETHIFSLDGTFNNLLKLVYQLEQKYQAGKISSVLFRSDLDNKSKRKYLQATVYIQHISKSSTDE
jgi:hypothetical protein